MTRSSSVRPLLRVAATAVVALAMLPLSGCLYAQIPVNVPDGDDPDPVPTDSPSDDPIDEPSGDLPATLSFADGNDLPPDAYIEWGDGFFTDDGWEVVTGDDGNGGWTYGTLDGTCTAEFWQGMIPDVPTVAGDDGASSDAMLAVILGEADSSNVTPSATTGGFSYQTGGNLDVENRQLTGGEGSREWIVAARAFTATGVGLYVIVDCTAGDARAAMAEVVDVNSIIVG